MILPTSGAPRPGESYRHRQMGWPTFVIVGSVLLFVAGIVAVAQAMAAFVIVAIVTLAVLLLFSSLTVSVTDTHVSLHFGIGIIRKHFALDTIRSCRVVRNAWYHGTGIRMIQGGWLYNVAGRLAVELERNDGSIVRIGSDEPERLLEAIQQAAKLAPRGGEYEALSDSGGYWPVLVVVPVLVAIGVMLYLGMRAPRVFVGRDLFTVQSGFYKAEIPVREITEVVVSDSLPRIAARTNGLSAGSARRGHFRLDSLGAGMLFLDRGFPPYVVVRTADRYVIVGYKDPRYTRELIEALAKASAP